MNTAIKCGNCKGTHTTAQEVRACYGIGEGWTNEQIDAHVHEEEMLPCEAKAIATGKVRSLTIEPDLASAKQVNFMVSLANERELTVDPEFLAQLTKKEASAMIQKMLAMPKLVTQAFTGYTISELLVNVEDGYYAMPCKTGNNDLDFVRIGTNQGKFNPADKGKRRVQRYLGGQGPIQITYPEQSAFANIIADMTPAQRKEAQVLFGREIGQCGVCGKPLTDQDSRAKGIGPVCEAGF